MDSLSQLALGAAVGIGVMGRRTAVWKAALWGGVCGTLPDLDAFIEHGDPISNMTLHRADSHALFWLTLLAPALAWVVSRLHHEPRLWRRWWLAVWLALVTHPLLDLMTVYGTQLARPFSDRPFGVGSIFIIDPLYTLPLLVGVAAALLWRDRGDAGGRVGGRALDGTRGLRWNLAGLALSTAYLGWSFIAQQHVVSVAKASLARQNIATSALLVTPTPFNTVLWRVVAVTDDAHHEGFYALLDATPELHFDRFDRGRPLYDALAGQAMVGRIAWFSRGFFKLSQRRDQVLISDLRMGQEPNYTFSFVVAEHNGAGLRPVAVPTSAGGLPDVASSLAWLWQRAQGHRVAPPR